MTENNRPQAGPESSSGDVLPPAPIAIPDGQNVSSFAVRRVVTGHDKSGKSIVLSDGLPPFVFSSPALPGYVSYDLFRTLETPASIAAETAESTAGPRRQLPTPSGTVIRVSQVPPTHTATAKLDSAAASEAFKALGNSAGHTGNSSARSSLMHRTESIDYVVVLSGELTLVLDDSDVILRSGDVLVQCGTNHSWENRSNAPVTVMFILISGKYDQALTEILPSAPQVKGS